MYDQEFLTSNPIIHGDCLAVLDKIPSNSIHQILVDPPYKLGKVKFENKEKQYSRVVEEWDNQWENESDYAMWCRRWLMQSKRVLVDGGSIQVFCSHHNIKEVKYGLDEMLTFRNMIPWYVTNAMPIKFAKKIGIYAHSCQYILYYSKGPIRHFDYEYLKGINGGKQHRDIFIQSARKHHPNLKHPTRKPDALIEKLIQAHSRPGDIVLDYFLGSGTTAVNARRLGRNFIGSDSQSEYIEEAVWRLDNDI